MKIDLEIYNRLLSRDETGLSLLYQNYSKSLYGIAFRVLGSHFYAEDAIQKSFLKIWNNIDQYNPERSTLYTWMAQIVRNTSIDIRRLKSFQKEEKSDSLDTSVHNVKTSRSNTDHLDISTLLEGMDEKYLFVLEHLYLKGYTQSELSKEFNIPLGTIKTRVKKGIDILRTKLSKEQKLFLGMLLIVLLTILIFI